MALFPVYGVFKGDFVPHLVAVDTDDTMDQVANKIAAHSVGRRVPDRPGLHMFRVEIGARIVPGDLPLSLVMEQTGLRPLQWVTVDWAS